jgi:saccharopine dehydrogenase (NAD+, L-lysine-forming)
MRVAVLGAGGLGRAAALELVADPRVSEIVVMDRRRDRSKTLTAVGRETSVTALQGDVTDGTFLRQALRGCDVAINATLPQHNLAVMRACYDATCGYVDSSACSPTTPGEVWGVLDQLALDDLWKARGITAVPSMGSDPGISNVMARIAADRFETIDSIRIRWAASGTKDIEGFPLYSREMFLRDALSLPVVWDGHALVEADIGSGEEEFEFPPPIGRRPVHLFRHEEVLTLPLRLGKPVGHVDYKHAIDVNLIQSIKELQALDLLASERKVRVGSRSVPFRDLFLAAWPEPSTLVGLMEGVLTIVVEVRGTRVGGGPGTVRVWTMVEHKEANRRRGTTAEYFLTAASATTGAILIGLHKTPRTGVLAAEEIPPDLILPEFRLRGIELNVADLPAS